MSPSYRSSPSKLFSPPLSVDCSQGTITVGGNMVAAKAGHRRQRRRAGQRQRLPGPAASGSLLLGMGADMSGAKLTGFESGEHMTGVTVTEPSGVDHVDTVSFKLHDSGTHALERTRSPRLGASRTTPDRRSS
jgi:hypothetical protein